jgi:catechol 2,3-dioxygenase-like lactoylglutathione lyase family enzyme
VLGWAIDGVDQPIDGLPRAEGIPTATGDAGGAPEDAATAPSHPNGISGIDHVVVLTGDVDRTVAAFGEAGLEARGERHTDDYGSPMRQVFCWAGDVIVEIVGPEAAGAEGTDSGQPTPHPDPASIFGLALVADDLDATGARLGDLLATPKDAVQPGRRIAGLRGREVGISIPIAVMSPHVRGT